MRGKLTKSIYAGMTDCVDIGQQVRKQELEPFLRFCVDNHFHTIAAPYCYHEYVMELLKKWGKEKSICLTGGAGFPDGNWSREAKIASLKHCLSIGCSEFDLTSNLSWIKSGMWDELLDEIKMTREIIGSSICLKVICHIPALTDDEIAKMSDLVASCGYVDFLKTATGREIPSGVTTIDMVKKVQVATRGRIKIKVSGGVRDTQKVKDLYAMGVDRFGCSYTSGQRIISELDAE